MASGLERQTALKQADALVDESAAADFILQCEFADARLKAADRIQSKPLLERVLHAMRNADRRVAKLMQQRLDQMTGAETREQKGASCIFEAQRLVEDAHLKPNQVVDLDHAWQLVGDVPQDLSDRFHQLRAVLRERLEGQAALQRSALDTRSQLKRVMVALQETPVADDAAHARTPFEIGRTLDILERAMAQHCAAAEASSLPRHLAAEFAAELDSARQLLAGLEQRHAAWSARAAALAGWEAQPDAALNADSLKREWQALPRLDRPDAALDARFHALIERSGGAADKPHKMRDRKPGMTQDPTAMESVEKSTEHFVELLERMEKALEQGALLPAVEHDKGLRALDLKTVRLSDKQTARLSRARSELGRLQGWAKWGGNLSRDELLKAAEDLQLQKMAPAELAKKVGALRECWKSLDASAGPAPKAFWERFDVACTAAYAPAAEHFKKLAEERKDNFGKAEAMIAEIRQFAEASGCSAAEPGQVDWKAVAAYCMRTSQAWQRLGPVGRKEKKNLDGEFGAAMKLLMKPLAAQRLAEISRREKLIVQATELDPKERGAPEKLRALQERWQVQAKSLPLDRHDEQALWLRFRAACDTVFAERKQATRTANADRQQHLASKEALCATLEAGRDAPEHDIPKIMRSARDEWAKIGAVPHAAERKIEARYQAALAALQNRLEIAKRAQQEARSHALRDKLALCQLAEQAVLDNQTDEELLARWRATWQSLPASPPAFEQVMRIRFDAALDALQSGAREYAAVLEKNRSVLAHEVLRTEILFKLDSPPELSGERLKLQVEALKSSLKAGQKEGAGAEALPRLCGIAAPPDKPLAERILRLIAAA